MASGVLDLAEFHAQCEKGRKTTAGHVNFTHRESTIVITQNDEYSIKKNIIEMSFCPPSLKSDTVLLHRYHYCANNVCQTRKRMGFIYNECPEGT